MTTPVVASTSSHPSEAARLRRPRRIRAPLHTLCAGVDLTALPGLGRYGALKLVSEISKWGSLALRRRAGRGGSGGASGG